MIDRIEIDTTKTSQNRICYSFTHHVLPRPANDKSIFIWNEVMPETAFGMEEEIQNFWQNNPCGAGLVGDLSEESRTAYLEFFDRYDNYRYTKEPHILENLKKIDFRDKQVLEIGLGQGTDGEQIVKQGGIYSAVDLTEESVKRVQTRFELKNLPFEEVQQASALELPFKDNSFDIVFSHGVLHHIPEIDRAQKEIARVLRPGGRLIAMLYARHSVNYLISISIVRRLGLAALYMSGINPGGFYDYHLKQVRKTGLLNYLKMSNFIHVNTDGPFNPYSKVYDMPTVKSDFSDFYILNSHKHFMYAPPLPFGWLPLGGVLGWHLWVEMEPIK